MFMICDSTEGVIGFEQTRYIVEEMDGFVELCVAILTPNNASLFDPVVAVSFFVETMDGTALGI